MKSFAEREEYDLCALTADIKSILIGEGIETKNVKFEIVSYDLRLTIWLSVGE